VPPFNVSSSSHQPRLLTKNLSNRRLQPIFFTIILWKRPNFLSKCSSQPPSHCSRVLPVLLWLPPTPQEAQCVRFMLRLKLLFIFEWLIISLQSLAAVDMMNANPLEARDDCNGPNCASVVAAIACLELAVELPLGATAAAVGCVIGGAQAVSSLSNLPSATRTDRARSVHVSTAFPQLVQVCRVSVSALLEWP
jgi:hypothetical protein